MRKRTRSSPPRGRQDGSVRRRPPRPRRRRRLTAAQRRTDYARRHGREGENLLAAALDGFRFVRNKALSVGGSSSPKTRISLDFLVAAGDRLFCIEVKRYDGAGSRTVLGAPGYSPDGRLRGPNVHAPRAGFCLWSIKESRKWPAYRLLHEEAQIDRQRRVALRWLRRHPEWLRRAGLDVPNLQAVDELVVIEGDLRSIYAPLNPRSTVKVYNPMPHLHFVGVDSKATSNELRRKIIEAIRQAAARCS
jgi:hypothetical protein